MVSNPSHWITLEIARWRLAALWFSGSAILFLVLVAQSLGGRYEGEIGKAWAWALPNIMPTLSLIISVFAAYAMVRNTEEDRLKVRRNFFWLSFWLSAFYLINVITVVVAAALSPPSTGNVVVTPLPILLNANFWLGPLQALTAGTLAALFFNKSD